MSVCVSPWELPPLSNLLAGNPENVNNATLSHRLGLFDIDALHIALAEKVNINYFVTCDDDIIKTYRKNKSKMKIKIVDLIELIRLEG